MYVCMYMRASLEFFSHSKTAISFNIFVGIYFRYFVSETYTINAVSFYYLWLGAIINDSIPTNTNIE